MDAPTRDLPRPESTLEFRVPSGYQRCRAAHCHQPPVADMNRKGYRRNRGYGDLWYAYCAVHLRGYNREVRDGRVWWLGYPEGEG